MVHVLSGRAETPAQSRILTYVRDEGPLSRIDPAAYRAGKVDCDEGYLEAGEELRLIPVL